MKINYGSILVVFLVLVCWNVVAISQDWDLAEIAVPKNLANLDSATAHIQAVQNLDDAVEPLLDLFGFYTGGGLYHSAKVHGMGGFDVGIRVITMMVSDDQKPPLPNADPKYEGGVFRDVSLTPLPLLQVSVGLPGSLEATGRFFTYPIKRDTTEGFIGLIGLGVKYGLLQNILLPRVSIVAVYHYLSVPSEFDFGSVNSLSAALVISKNFQIVDIYGGLGYDYTTLKIDLEFPDPIGPVTKEYNKGNFRGNLGIKVKPIPLLYIHADYNFGGVQGFNAGLGINFR
ncbi:MAG: hypothetical protein JSW07_19755 [bacterium]|nr:MAG: hypothetical protein JSW07_19755 [bacterium]